MIFYSNKTYIFISIAQLLHKHFFALGISTCKIFKVNNRYGSHMYLIYRCCVTNVDLSIKNYKRNNLIGIIPAFFLFLFMPVIFSSCAKKNYLHGINYNLSGDQQVPDYSKLAYWASHPWKYDPADNTPSSLPKVANDSLADVFFIHP